MRSYDRLPTAAKLLLLISLALLPIGLAMVWAARIGISTANAALDQRALEQNQSATRAVEALIARNALALRIAAGGAIGAPGADDCGQAQRSLEMAPAISRNFSIEIAGSGLHCTTPGFPRQKPTRTIGANGVALSIDPATKALFVRVIVPGGLATGRIAFADLIAATRDVAPDLLLLEIDDGTASATLLGERDDRLRFSNDLDTKIALGQLSVHVAVPRERLSTADWLVLWLPLAMWVIAALISWLLVTRLLIRPLLRLEQAVANYDPNDGAFALPSRIGPAIEIESLGNAFAVAVERIEKSEREMSIALDGQRRLVREVHHRVKNNLQVVASLLSIHGRNAVAAEGRAAYAAIGRRVEALSVVHRNHYAEGESHRGIALRPLLTELAAGLRGSAPDHARNAAIILDLDDAYTTQDVAVAAAFLITEIIEFAMLRMPEAAIEIGLRRTGELTSRLSIESGVLTDSDGSDRDRQQFERIVTGLARQLRSSLEMRLGRLSVELPVFPA